MREQQTADDRDAEWAAQPAEGRRPKPEGRKKAEVFASGNCSGPSVGQTSGPMALGFPPMPFGYSLRGHCQTERRKDRWFGNPKGIVSSSPGLPSPRGYPGLASVRFSTPPGLCPRSAIAPQPRWGWPTPPAFPRVARGSQPWALGRNPFGIQRWNFRKAGAQILAALDYKSALRHSSCGHGHSGKDKSILGF